MDASGNIFALLEVVESNDDAFVVVSEEGRLDLNWQELLLVLL